MEHQEKEIKTSKSLTQHFCAAMRKAAARRPVSFYLLVAILVMVMLGSPYLAGKENPKKFAFFLILNFIFFFFVTVRAIIDFFEISKEHFSESHKLYGDTIGDQDFAEELGRNVTKNLKK